MTQTIAGGSMHSRCLLGCNLWGLHGSPEVHCLCRDNSDKKTEEKRKRNQSLE